MKKLLLLLLCGLIILVSNSCKSETDMTSVGDINYKSSLLNDGTIIHKFNINGKDIYVNEKDGVYYYAEDMIISQEQFNILRSQANTNATTIARSTIASSFAKTWPDGIIYYQMPIKGSLSTKHYETFKKNIDSAFNMISVKTDIQFIERTTQEEYISFVYSENSNSSPVGWTKGKINQIKIYNTTYPAIIAHEILHSMGFKHEQSRPDRDKYMIVLLNRVKPGFEHNFNTSSDFSGYGKFDFGSVMMYQSTDFAKDPRKPVMMKLDSTTFTKQRTHLSDGDIAGINHLYGPLYSSKVLGTYNISLSTDNKKYIGFEKVSDGEDILIRDTNGKNERFIFRKSEHGHYFITSVSDATKVLTVKDNDSKNGTVVLLKRNRGQDNQKWLLYNLGNEGFSFAPKSAPSLRLEVKKGSDNKEIVVIGNKLNDKKQRFTLKKV